MTVTAQVTYCPDYMWCYPLVTVFAPDKAHAGLIARSDIDPFDLDAYRELARDACDALTRMAEQCCDYCGQPANDKGPVTKDEMGGWMHRACREKFTRERPR